MATILEDLAVFLPTQSLGYTFGTNLFAQLMPDQPDALTSMFEYPGNAPEYVFGAANPQPALSHPRIQVVVRDTNPLTARSTIEAVTKKLEAVVNQTINGTYYERIERLQDPFFLHRDAKRRSFYAVNLTVTKAG